MKRFSFMAFSAFAFLHIAGTTWLILAAISRMHAYDRGETFPWLTAVSWIWMPVPMWLSHNFHLGTAGYFYYLALPWSLFVALCCGLLSRTFHADDTVWPNQSMEPTAGRWAARLKNEVKIDRATACRGLSPSR
jgi:hypothetical protein